MTDIQVAANPFGMMINPEAIIEAMNRSDRLERLQRRVYRPLDKPMIPKVDATGNATVVEIDEEESDEDFGVASAATDMSDVIAVSDRVLAY
ncbi:hypothetical protein BH09PSE5_BH09PSE5_47500 [soil metagenome]